jgi:hypothetical protein
MVEIQIGTYNDVILCDTMPMDVYHIRLGRPWQYDRKAIHDGRGNIYSLDKDGKKHVLLPLKDKASKSELGPSIFSMSGKGLL